MKMFFTFLLTFFLLYFNAMAQSDSYLSEFTMLKEGDIVKPLTKQPKDLRVYLFLDQNSCAVCLHIIPEIREIVADESLNIEYVIFFSNIDSKSANEIAEQKDWKYEIITDFNNVYTDFYKIKQLPTYFIADKDGKILFADKLGGTRTKKSVLLNTLEIARNNRVRKDGRIISSIEINNHFGNRIHTSHIRKIIYDSKDKMYIFNYDASAYLYFVKDDGNFLNFLPLDSILQKYGERADNLIDIQYLPESNELVMNMHTLGVLQHILHYNLSTNESKLLNLKHLERREPMIKPGLNLAHIKSVDTYFISLYFKQMKLEDFKGGIPQILILKDSLNGLANLMDIIYYEMESRKGIEDENWGHKVLKVYDDNVYSIQMFGYEVIEMNVSGDIKNIYEIKNSKYYRYNPEPMKNYQREEYTYFRSRASINEDLLIDETNGKIYVYFQNMHPVDETTVKLGNKNPTNHYLIQVGCEDGEICGEYHLPKDHIPFHIENGIVHTSTNEGGLTIHQVRLE